ncbi:MAG: Rieske 2Fe-2S domain-containing protein [Caldilineaceae bacterium]|nr:Rieske 2Fe-2S domain-containing protein [Caldilineaceae bacterium]
MANEQWQARVERAQQMAAARRGVDVEVMLPPRQPGAGAPATGGAAAHAAEAEPATTAAQPAQSTVVAEPTPVAAVESAPAPASSAAQRVAEAKARAASKGSSSNGGATAAAVAPTTVATPSAAPARSAATPAPATAERAEAQEVGQPGINRREFMTYAWGAALGLLTLEIGVASYAFMYPRFRAGEFGGAFPVPLGEIPPADAGPNGNTTGKFWLVDTAEGPKALYMVCTHLGCLYKWEPSNFRFECPCHGSMFNHDGHYILGPAPRSLDQFVIEVVQNGQVVSSTEDAGDRIVPPQVPGPDVELLIQTGRRIVGKSKDLSPARADA